MVQVEHGGGSRGAVEEVSHVLKAYENLVSVLWEEVDLEITVKVSNWSRGNVGCFRKLVALSLGNEESNRLVNHELHLTLLGGGLGVIKHLDEVSGVNLDTLAECVGLVKRFSNTTPVVVQKTSVLHDLNHTVGENGSTLGAIVHDSKLHVSGWASNGEG